MMKLSFTERGLEEQAQEREETSVVLGVVSMR